MGAGGFLISNYQEELAEYFVRDEDMVIYEGIEDAIEKISFYLEHDDIREKIARSGRTKTLEFHTMQERLDIIFETVGI